MREVRRGHCGGARVSAVGQVAGEDLSACSGVVKRCLEEEGLLLIHFNLLYLKYIPENSFTYRRFGAFRNTVSRCGWSASLVHC